MNIKAAKAIRKGGLWVVTVVTANRITTYTTKHWPLATMPAGGYV